MPPALTDTLDQMSPLGIVLIIFGISCAFAWVASLLSGDTSWVDREWSLVPIAYVWVFALAAGLSSTRLDLMAVLVTLWGLRLTFNFARKGGYSGVEDYRWAVLRQSMSKWQFQLFNFFFIVLYQNALLVLITLPAWTAYQHRSAPLGLLDVLLMIAFLASTAGETIADQQQWDFHQLKHDALAAGRQPSSQFCQTRPLPLLAPPQLLLRTGPVVALLRHRSRRCRLGARVDRARRGALDRAVHRLHALH